MFCKKLSATGSNLMVVALLYEMQSPCNFFTFLYAVAIVVEAIVGVTTTTLRWRSRCQAGDDGNHDGALLMEIKGTGWLWPYHVTYFDCMWCLSFYASYFSWYGGSIIRWSLTKFQGISVLPEYAPLLQFVVPRHHVMIGCDKLYVHIQRVQDSFAHAEYLG